MGAVDEEFDVGARSHGDEELRTIYEEMEQMGNASAKLPESIIVNFCTH